MAKYRIKMDGNSPQMKELSKMEELALNKKKKTVSLTLTKTMLEHMRKAAGIKVGTDEQILKAFITKTIQDAEI